MFKVYVDPASVSPNHDAVVRSAALLRVDRQVVVAMCDMSDLGIGGDLVTLGPPGRARRMLRPCVTSLGVKSAPSCVMVVMWRKVPIFSDIFEYQQAS